MALTPDQQSQVIDGASMNTPESLTAAAAAFQQGAPELFKGSSGPQSFGIDPDELPTLLFPFTGAHQIPAVDVSKQFDNVPGGIPWYNNQGGVATLQILGADMKHHRKSGFITDNTWMHWLAAQLQTTPEGARDRIKELYKALGRPPLRTEIIS